MRKGSVRLIIILVLLATLATTGVWAQESAVAAILARGKLVVICFPQQDSPFVSVNIDTGPMRRVGTIENFKGIDIDLMNAFAKHLGVLLEIHTIGTPDYNELIPSLLRSDGDVIIGGFNITPDREKLVDFAGPYFAVSRVVIVPKKSRITTLKGLSGKTVAVVPGSSQLEAAKQLAIPNLRFKQVDFTRDAYLAVQDKQADFTVADSVNSATMLDEFPNLKVGFSLSGAEKYGFAVTKGSDLKTRLTTFLITFSETDVFSAIFNRHLKKH